MTASMTLTIQDFNALMTKPEENSKLLDILRKLTVPADQQQVIEKFILPPRSLASWAGWR